MIWSAVPWKLVGYGVLAAAVGLLTWRVIAWHHAYHDELPAALAALKLEVECGPGSQCQAREEALRKAQAAKEAEVIGEYERELADLRNRPVPTTPVRLCRPANRGAVRDGSTAGPVSPSGGAELPVEVGRDIRVELYRLADDADAEALKLKALWQWNEALSR